MILTCKTVDTVLEPKMNSMHSRKTLSSNSSGFRLLDGDHQEAASNSSRNSVYKLKIDLMFDDTRSVLNKRLDDTRGSHRTRSIIMYGRSELASTKQSTQPITSVESTDATIKSATCTKKNVKRISNSVQEQIEQLFTDVAKDATSSFEVIYLGSLPLKDKVTSLQGLQEPLRQLYIKELHTTKQMTGFLEICTLGLIVKTCSGYEESTTPFHNIAVWSAVKLFISESYGGAAFLPLITDPGNTENTSLFHPLRGTERHQLANNGGDPIFTVVMRCTNLPKVLKCHAFICKTTEDAIVIAATLYQNLMAHVNSSSNRSTKRRTPRNNNGVSCISIASSSVLTGSNYLSHSLVPSSGRRNYFRSSSESFGAEEAYPVRIGRKKRVSSNSLTSNHNLINEAETTTEERKRKSHKNKRAPPVPKDNQVGVTADNKSPRSAIGRKKSFCDDCGGGGHMTVPDALGGSSCTLTRTETNGDILTRVAIPRSGSFLNTGGLTRYKSKAARRHSGKLGGGGGSPLGFSELFNEFRLHENLNSLDEILNVIIDVDGMSFNDLKPIYKEFLLKLAVTLTKDELFQRSKNIMRRQRKKKLRRGSASVTQKKTKILVFGTKSFNKVFHMGQLMSCRAKPMKLSRNKKSEDMSDRRISESSVVKHSNDLQRIRVATSGSEVSMVCNDNNFRGLNRNSSSGYVAGSTIYSPDYNYCNCSYVSCSECSYDSESCTCTSADRCYCSLRTDHIKHRLRCNDNRNPALPSSNINRDSLVSCKSDEKCYCSMIEVKSGSAVPAGDFANTESDTSWCDTDSCVSTSKCYCQRMDRQTTSASRETNKPKSYQESSSVRKVAEKLALDYELFTINGNSKTPNEALSVKKSVEAAAIFADVKLSQTTDIKSICQLPLVLSKASVSIKNGCHEEGQKYSRSEKWYDSLSIDRPHESSLSSNPSQKVQQSEGLLGKSKTMEGYVRAESVKNSPIKGQAKLAVFEKRGNNCQSVPAVNVSLEETLGYLP